MKFLFPVLLFLGTLYGLLQFLSDPRMRSKGEAGQLIYKSLSPGNPSVFPEYKEIMTHLPLVRFEHSLVRGNELIYRVEYDHDEWGLRREPRSEAAKEHLIIGGCSMVFGIGVDVSETVTSQLRRYLPDYQMLNFSQPLGGLHTLLRALELIPLRKLAPGNEGTFVYMFFTAHVNRWMGSPSYLAAATPDRVHYEAKSGYLQRMQLRDTEMWQNLYRAKHAGLEEVYLRTHSLSNWDKAVLVSFLTGVKELKKRYLSLYPKGKFLVAFHPLHADDENFRRLSEALERSAISFIDLKKDMDVYLRGHNLQMEDLQIPLDLHPNAKMNREVARILSGIVKAL